MILNDEVLKELIKLEKEVKIKSKRIQEIRDACKTKGSFCTFSFVCSVWEQERTAIAGLQECIAALTKEVLEGHELIKTSRFLLVKVAPLLSKKVKNK